MLIDPAQCAHKSFYHQLVFLSPVDKSFYHQLFFYPVQKVILSSTCFLIISSSFYPLYISLFIISSSFYPLYILITYLLFCFFCKCICICICFCFLFVLCICALTSWISHLSSLWNWRHFSAWISGMRTWKSFCWITLISLFIFWYLFLFCPFINNQMLYLGNANVVKFTLDLFFIFEYLYCLFLFCPFINNHLFYQQSDVICRQGEIEGWRRE